MVRVGARRCRLPCAASRSAAATPATIDEWIDAGEYRDAHEPDVRRAMARELVRFHELATGSGVRPRRPFFPLGDEALWPVPHNALFDFEKTRAGAEWIDDIARAAKPVRLGRGQRGRRPHRLEREAPALRLRSASDGGLRLGQRDHGSRATACRERGGELHLHGGAVLRDRGLAERRRNRSRSWTSTRDGAWQPFTAGERRSAHGACVYLRAYAARCGTPSAATRGVRPRVVFAEALL